MQISFGFSVFGLAKHLAQKDREIFSPQKYPTHVHVRRDSVSPKEKEEKINISSMLILSF